MKFVVRDKEAAVILDLLCKFRVSPATLFPGFDGVVASMREEDSWRKHDRPPSVGYQRKLENA